MNIDISTLRNEVKKCTHCIERLPLGPNPVIQIGEKASVLIAGQAPGKKVHETSIPFNDPSGDRLRDWMGISKEVFYDENKVAILPMGFCFPGTGKSGDLPPLPECADKWRNNLLAAMPNIQLTLLVGTYAQKWHLRNMSKKNLTLTVQAWQDYWPTILPLPHPSPRNNIWLKKNDWFESDVVPELQHRIRALLP